VEPKRGGRAGGTRDFLSIRSFLGNEREKKKQELFQKDIGGEAPKQGCSLPWSGKGTIKWPERGSPEISENRKDRTRNQKRGIILWTAQGIQTTGKANGGHRKGWGEAPGLSKLATSASGKGQGEDHHPCFFNQLNKRKIGPLNTGKKKWSQGPRGTKKVIES